MADSDFFLGPIPLLVGCVGSLLSGFRALDIVLFAIASMDVCSSSVLPIEISSVLPIENRLADRRIQVESRLLSRSRIGGNWFEVSVLKTGIDAFRTIPRGRAATARGLSLESDMIGAEGSILAQRF